MKKEALQVKRTTEEAQQHIFHAQSDFLFQLHFSIVIRTKHQEDTKCRCNGR